MDGHTAGARGCAGRREAEGWLAVAGSASGTVSTFSLDSPRAAAAGRAASPCLSESGGGCGAVASDRDQLDHRTCPPRPLLSFQQLGSRGLIQHRAGFSHAEVVSISSTLKSDELPETEGTKEPPKARWNATGVERQGSALEPPLFLLPTAGAAWASCGSPAAGRREAVDPRSWMNQMLRSQHEGPGIHTTREGMRLETRLYSTLA